jgi:hypothetical protein
MLAFKQKLVLVFDDGEEVSIERTEFVSVNDLKEAVIKAVYGKRCRSEASLSRAASIAAWDCGYEGNSSIFRRVRK